jgi:hypothetical protein
MLYIFKKKYFKINFTDYDARILNREKIYLIQFKAETKTSSKKRDSTRKSVDRDLIIAQICVMDRQRLINLP